MGLAEMFAVRNCFALLKNFTRKKKVRILEEFLKRQSGERVIQGEGRGSSNDGGGSDGDFGGVVGPATTTTTTSSEHCADVSDSPRQQQRSFDKTASGDDDDDERGDGGAFSSSLDLLWTTLPTSSKEIPTADDIISVENEITRLWSELRRARNHKTRLSKRKK